MIKICSNCFEECDRLRKLMCTKCYTKNRLFGDPNYIHRRASCFPERFTEQQNNIIIGSILGDGHVRRDESYHNAYLIIKRALKDLAYLEWESDILNDIAAPAGITQRETYDNRTGETYYSCSFSTRALVAMSHFHDQWYKDKIKIVPNDLKLNAEIIAVWFCDDGTIDTSSSDNRFRASFATNSFTKDEVYFLCGLLNDRYNENFLINKTIDEETNKEQFIIHGSDSAIRTMITDIDPVFPQGMQRKRLWDKPESCYYENQPPRRKSHKASSTDKREKIVEYLKIHDEFDLINLGDFAGFRFDQRSGRKGDNEIATSNLKRHYLKSFIANGMIVEIGKDKNAQNTRIKYQLTDAGKQFFRA